MTRATARVNGLVEHRINVAKIKSLVPESMLAMMVFSPNLPFCQAELISFPRNPRNSHERVVCSLCSLLKNTDTTFGFSAYMLKTSCSEVEKLKH